MLNDIRYGLRQLWKHLGFTIVAVLTLALGIGANTAIFSVVNAVLLKPLPFPAPDELIAVGAIDTRQKATQTDLSSLSYPDFFDYRGQNRTLQNIAVYRPRSFALTGEAGASSVPGIKSSAEYFDVLGIKPKIGRTFTRADEQGGGGPGGFKVIISHDYWQKNFGGDASVLGRTLMMDRRPDTISWVLSGGCAFM